MPDDAISRPPGGEIRPLPRVATPDERRLSSLVRDLERQIAGLRAELAAERARKGPPILSGDVETLTRLREENDRLREINDELARELERRG